MEIRFQTIKIDTISQTSGLFTGDNFQHGAKAITKINEGQGSVSGDQNKIKDNKSVVIELEANEK
ncbi:hypothetical protein [Anaerobacillus alkaliphilus]|uniref:hypothetical protein n=1 Tax=Anaerobacillus alkaliphilus TaxID=1548597 RepID=UPI0019D68D15|nr:hypothetical protein [Anaerobacillus alkaliphilus]